MGRFLLQGDGGKTQRQREGGEKRQKKKQKKKMPGNMNSGICAGGREKIAF